MYTDIYHREFAVSNKALELTDKSYGYSIGIETYTFTTEERSTLCTVNISSFDRLKISTDFVLVSALYSIQFTCKPQKSVTLKIQHCGDDDMLQHLTFVHANKNGAWYIA